jgi:integrase
LWKDLGFVFTSRDGGPLYATNLKRPFRRLLGKAGLRRVRFHDLRHTTATLLLGQGVHPKIVSEMLGHSSIGITLDLYSHATPTMQERLLPLSMTSWGRRRTDHQMADSRLVPHRMTRDLLKPLIRIRCLESSSAAICLAFE